MSLKENILGGTIIDFKLVSSRYDQNWWIGRKVQIGCDIGFIPSPAKLETLRIQNAQNKTAKIYANKQNSSANLTKFLQKKSNEIKQSVNHNTGANSDGDMEDEDAETKKVVVEEPPPTAQSLVEQERKKKGLLGRKVSQLLWYKIRILNNLHFNFRLNKFLPTMWFPPCVPW